MFIAELRTARKIQESMLCTRKSIEKEGFPKNQTELASLQRLAEINMHKADEKYNSAYLKLLKWENIEMAYNSNFLEKAISNIILPIVSKKLDVWGETSITCEELYNELKTLTKKS